MKTNALPALTLGFPCWVGAARAQPPAGGAVLALDADFPPGIPWLKGVVGPESKMSLVGADGHAGLKRFYYFLSSGDQFWRARVMTDMKTFAAHTAKSGDLGARNVPRLGRQAPEKLAGDESVKIAKTSAVSSPNVVKSVTDAASLGRSVGWQQQDVVSEHWALNAIETKEMARAWPADWGNEFLKSIPSLKE